MSFIAARLKSGHVPPNRELPVAAGEAFEQGALLLVNASGEYEECAADPAAIAAVSESAFGADTSGFNRLGVREFPPGMMQGTKVQGQQFHAEYVGTLPAAIGGSYGVVRDTDGRWKVDFDETVETRVKLVGFWTDAPINKNRVFVEFLAANVQVI